MKIMYISKVPKYCILDYLIKDLSLGTVFECMTFINDKIWYIPKLEITIYPYEQHYFKVLKE